VTGPRNARTDSRGRLYDWNGEKFWSVTTILQAVPKPALVGWSAREAATFAVDNWKQISALIRKQEREAAASLVKNAANRNRDRAANVGTSVHQAIEALILDKPMPDWDEQIAGHMDQFLEFVKDFDVTFEAAEAQAFSRSERYAGSFDFIGTIPKIGEVASGPRVLGDVKTGKGIYPEVALQLAAYAHAEFVGMPNGTEVPLPAVDCGVALHLRSDGYALVPVRIDDEVFKSFLYVREVWRWMNEIADDVLGVPLDRESVLTP